MFKLFKPGRLVFKEAPVPEPAPAPAPNAPKDTAPEKPEVNLDSIKFDAAKAKAQMLKSLDGMGYKLTKAEILEKAGKLKADDGGRSLSLAAATKLDANDIESYFAVKGGDKYLNGIFSRGMDKIKKEVAAGKVKVADVTPERVVATGLSLEEYRNYRGRLSKFILIYGKYNANEDKTELPKPKPPKSEPVPEKQESPKLKTRETEQEKIENTIFEKTVKVGEKLEGTILQAEGRGNTIESAFRNAAQKILNQLEKACGEKRRMSPGEVIGYFYGKKIPVEKLKVGENLKYARITSSGQKIDDKHFVNISIPKEEELDLIASYLGHSPWDAGHKKVGREAMTPAAAPDSTSDLLVPIIERAKKPEKIVPNPYLEQSRNDEMGQKETRLNNAVNKWKEEISARGESIDKKVAKERAYELLAEKLAKALEGACGERHSLPERSIAYQCEKNSWAEVTEEKDDMTGNHVVTLEFKESAKKALMRSYLEEPSKGSSRY